MDKNRLKSLAGMHTSVEDAKLERQLNEVVALPDDLSVEDAIQRLDACKRALALVNKMTDPVDKKKWLSKVFVNLNKVSAAVKRLSAVDAPAVQPAAPAARPAANGDGKFMIGDARI